MYECGEIMGLTPYLHGEDMGLTPYLHGDHENMGLISLFLGV